MLTDVAVGSHSHRCKYLRPKPVPVPSFSHHWSQEELSRVGCYRGNRSLNMWYPQQMLLSSVMVRIAGNWMRQGIG